MPLLTQNDHETIVGTYFRYARIKSIDPGEDTAGIILVDQDENDIPGTDIDGVPLYYHCAPDDVKKENGAVDGASAAFLSMDVVVVRFEDEIPVIVARRDGLRTCNDLLFVWDPVVCYDEGGGVVSCGDPEEDYSQREFEAHEVSGWSQLPEGLPQGLSPTTNYNCTTARQSSKHGWTWCRWSASKTVDNVTAHVFTYLTDPPSSAPMWFFRMDINGRDSGLALESFPDLAYTNAYDPYDTVHTYKGFDLWKEGNQIKASVASDLGEKLYLIDPQTKTYVEYSLNMRSWWRSQNPEAPSGAEDRHIRIIGLYRMKVYWAYGQFHYSQMNGVSNTWEEDVLTGQITELGINGAIVIWNEFTEEIVSIPGNEVTSEPGQSECFSLTPWYGADGKHIYCLKDSSSGWKPIDCKGTSPCQYVIHGGLNAPGNLTSRCEEDYWEKVTYTKWRDYCTAFPYGTKAVQSWGGFKYSDQKVVKCFFNVGIPCWKEHLPNCANERELGEVNCGSAMTCTAYSNWITSHTTLGASITPGTVGALIRLYLENGAECSGEQPDIQESTEDVTKGSYVENYASDAFPYYRRFAILKEAKDRSGNLYQEVHVQKGNSGVIFHTGGGPTVDAEHFFFLR
jgi:hypothetical protein